MMRLKVPNGIVNADQLRFYADCKLGAVSTMHYIVCVLVFESSCDVKIYLFSELKVLRNTDPRRVLLTSQHEQTYN